MKSKFAGNNTLVAVVPSRRDWNLIRAQGWYRIPVRFAPPMVKDGTIQYIAFYFPSVFGEEKQRIQWYSPVTSLVVRKRSELFPDEPQHKHAHWEYYVVGCADLRHLPHIIPSRKPRRLLFIPTTIQKLLTAPEINYLFNDSPLEDMLWLQLLEAGIPSERQYEVTVGQGRYKLDFAVFCKDRNLAIECDGDAHHMGRSAVERDKKRSNTLNSRGWSVLHFTTKELTTNMPGTMQVIRDTIAQYGGIWYKEDAA